jgi:ribonuclease Z
MPRLIILGSSSAIATAEHENTHLVIAGKERSVLVDCPNSPIVRLERAGVEPNTLTDLIVTHFHPDHVSGVPLLLLDMWLMGRRTPLDVHGLAPTLERLESLMEFHGWKKWPGFFPVSFHRVPPEEMTEVLAGSEFRIVSSPVKHMVPTIGLRLEVNTSKKSLAYSCDTEPCDEVRRLAGGVDVLVHEAAGMGLGHSSAAQAGMVASQAEAGRLLLIHYPSGKYRKGDPLQEAREHYQGDVALAEDFMVIDLD